MSRSLNQLTCERFHFYWRTTNTSIPIPPPIILEEQQAPFPFHEIHSNHLYAWSFLSTLHSTLDLTNQLLTNLPTAPTSLWTQPMPDNPSPSPEQPTQLPTSINTHGWSPIQNWDKNVIWLSMLVILLILNLELLNQNLNNLIRWFIWRKK